MTLIFNDFHRVLLIFNDFHRPVNTSLLVLLVPLPPQNPHHLCYHYHCQSTSLPDQKYHCLCIYIPSFQFSHLSLHHFSYHYHLCHSTHPRYYSLNQSTSPLPVPIPSQLAKNYASLSLKNKGKSKMDCLAIMLIFGPMSLTMRNLNMGSIQYLADFTAFW